MIELLNYLIANLPELCEFTITKDDKIERSMKITVINTFTKKFSAQVFTFEYIQDGSHIIKMSIHNSIEDMIKWVK
jgi:hypothetical protein